MPWVSLRSDYPALSPAQMNHLLSLYTPAPNCQDTWTPSVHEQASACSTGQSIFDSYNIHCSTGFCRIDFPTTTSQPPSVDILESFEMQHPLVLPDGGYQFQLGVNVTDSALWMELDKLKKFISTLSQSGEVTTTQAQKVPTMKEGFFSPTYAFDVFFSDVKIKPQLKRYMIVLILLIQSVSIKVKKIHLKFGNIRLTSS